VGEEIDANCSRCKEETIHRVVAMVDGRVHLVICTRCGSQHKYRSSLLQQRQRVALPTERQARVLLKLEAARRPLPKEPLAEWQRWRQASSQVKPLSYQKSAGYSEGESLRHPVFGLGFVRKVLSSTKMEVVFEKEVKVLVMNQPR